MAENITDKLPVMEHFYTIQGEGYYTGNAAYFIRLAGCNVGCVWCDVKESWQADKHQTFDPNEMVSWVENASAKMVVITGGEPLMYNLKELTAELKSKKIQTNLETSGAYPLTGNWDWVCVSPKKFKAPLAETIKHANELKVVVFNKSDFDWAEKNALLVNSDCKLYLQPEWDKSNDILPMLIDYIKQNPKWKISLQAHKFIGVD